MAKKKITRKTTASVTGAKIGREIGKEIDKCKTETHCCTSSKSACGGCAYFLGFLGAAIYYISTATGFWMGVLGVLKAMIWPLFLVLEVLKFIGA